MAEVVYVIRAVDQFSATASRVSGSLRTMEGAAGRFGGALSRAKGQIGGLIGGMGMLAGGAGLLGVGLAFKSAVQLAGDFEAQLNTINTIAFATPAALKEIGDGVRAVSKRTGIAVSDLTAAYYDLLSAGIKTADAQSVLNNAVTLGIGGLATTQQTVDLLTTAYNAYHLDAASAAIATDQFAQAVADGKVKADQIAASFANVASIANTYKVGIDQIATSYAFLTAQGVPATEVTTEMNRAIISLIKPLPALAEAQRRLKVNFTDEIQNKGLVPALQELRIYADKNKIPLIELLGRVEAVKFALQTTGPNFNGFLEEQKRIIGSQGMAAKQAAERQKGFNFELARLKANLEDAALTIGTFLLPVLADAAKSMSDFLGANQGGIAAFGKGLADAFHMAGKAIGTIAGAWNSVPKELRDLLVGGFVAQKASKFLFGAGPLDLLKSLVGLGGKKAGIGALAGIGVQHVWVDNMGVGGGGGGLPDAVGKTGLLATLAAALPIIIGASLPLIMLAALKAVGLGEADRGPGGTGGLNQPGPRAHIPISGAIPVVVVTPGSRSGSGSTGAPGSRSRSGLGATAAATFGPHSIAGSLFTSTLAEIIAGIKKRSAARFGGSGLGASAVDATFQRDILRAAGEVAKSSAGLSTKVGDLKSLQALLTQNGDAAAAKKIQALIDKLTPGAIGRAVAGALKSPTSAEGQHTRAEARRAADRARAAAAHQLDEQRETNRLLRHLKLSITNRDVTTNFVSTSHVGPQSGSNGRSSVLAGGA